MSARWHWLAGVVLGIATMSQADAPDAPRPARPAPYAIRVDLEGRARVGVLGIDRANLDALTRASWDPSRWSELLSVRVGIATVSDASPPIAGSYRVEGEALRFTPRFPVEPGLRHRVRFAPGRLPIPPDRSPAAPPIVTLDFDRPRPPAPASAFVVRVDPSGDRLPENLLKFYLRFSRPMSRGEAYHRVCLLDASGKPIDRPFLELGEELWDPTGTRLTLLLDPGRIKRGLRPREEEGPILESGQSYTLVISRDWPDADGHPLRETHRKRFLAGPADETQPDPKSWTLAPPVAGTLAPLSIRFPEPLDRALLERALVVRAPGGLPVAGRVTVDDKETRWQFLPAAPWTEGLHQVVVDMTLEDRAGNSVARPFEVDVLGPVRPSGKAEAETVSIPIAIRPRATPPRQDHSDQRR